MTSSADLAKLVDGTPAATGTAAQAGWLDRYDGALMNTFGPPQRVLVRGEGCYVWDADGRRYLDLLGGLAVNALGHAHPLLTAAISAQLATLGQVSNFFATGPQIALAERLVDLVRRRAGDDWPSGGSPSEAARVREDAAGSQPGAGERERSVGPHPHAGIRGGGPRVRVFFTNSGTEANEAAFKIARRAGRPRIVAADGGFHGRTIGALSMTGKPAITEPFEPLAPGVVHVPYGDADALAAAVDGETAAVMLEPIQGEAGVIDPPDGYLRAAREITSRNGALLMLDEVQTGIGRTGDWFGFHAAEIVPDVVTVAKGLGGGFPIGACIGIGDATSLLGPGSHGTTFGGNPVAAAAGLAVLHAIERDSLLANVTAVGVRLAEGVLALRHPLIEAVRGRGLLLGIALREPVAKQVHEAALEVGFIVNPVRPDTIRLAPPLILTAAQADEFLDALPDLFPS